MRDCFTIILIFIAVALLTAAPYAPCATLHGSAVARKKVNVGPTFVPTDVTGLVAWYKADAGILEGVADPAEDGDAVTIIEDQSVSGNDITVSNTTYRASRSGMPALDLADSHLHWNLATAITTNGASVFVVVETTDTVWMVCNETGVGTTFFGATQSGNTSSPHNASTDLAGTEYYVDGTVLSPQERGQLYTAGQAAGTNFIISCIDLDLRDYGSGTTLFGYSTSGFAFVGYVREVLIYNKAVNGTEQADIETYLARWP